MLDIELCSVLSVYNGAGRLCSHVRYGSFLSHIRYDVMFVFFLLAIRQYPEISKKQMTCKEVGT